MRDYLNKRQLCAVESAALNNPAAKIIVYSIKAEINKQLLNFYSNIRLLKIEFNEFIKKTPFEEWYKLNKNLLLNGPSWIEHTSDILRIVSLWKLGGYYSDLDTITLRSIQDLIHFNAFSFQNDSPLEVNNANMIFSRNNSLLFDLMQLMANNYNPNLWTGLGSIKINELIKIKCRKISIQQLIIPMANSHISTTPTKQCGLRLFSQQYFAPYNWNQWNLLFQSNQSLIISRFINAYSIHFYSKMSKNETSIKNSNSVYRFFAKLNCIPNSNSISGF